MAAGKVQPILVIKKKGGHEGHHGGAWKVAYADFVTAMMSLFIVLWLMNSSEKIKKAVAGYFNDPRGTASLMGTTMTGTGETVSVAASDNLQRLKDKLEQEIKARKELEKLSKQIEITVTSEGLRIELLEDKNGTFYQSGSARLSNNGQELLALLGSELQTLPNQLLIEGHTDAAPYSSDVEYSNWELSADRANAARRLLQQDGVRSDQVTQVRGYADQLLRVKKNPYDPSNRRISILVKNQEGPLMVVKTAAAVDGTKGATLAPVAQDAMPKPTTSPGGPASPNQVGRTSGASAAPAAKPSAAKAGLPSKIESMIPGSKK
ncbi:MAG: flagellar motor protein MotB [Terracidiphilus sp.]